MEEVKIRNFIRQRHVSGKSIKTRLQKTCKWLKEMKFSSFGSMDLNGLYYFLANQGSQCTAHHGHFKRMGGAVMHKHLLRKRERENLGFILKPAERARKYNAIPIPLKIGTDSLFLFSVLQLVLLR